MSFNTEFDFSDAVTYINSQITVETDKINVMQAELTEISSISTHGELTQARVNQLTTMINLGNSRKAKWQEILAQVNVVTTLAPADKQTLYDFWVVVQAIGEKKHMYMARFLYNYEKMITSATPVLADDSLSNDQKNALCKIILPQNSPTSDANKILTRL